MSTLLSVSSVFSYIGYIVLAIVVLLLMVLIHELGHYTAGKILNFKINEFSVGFGPKILQKKKRNGELISLRAFPLGGYCAFEGEGEEGDNPRSFSKQKPWKRLIVLFFGAFFNFLSAILFSFILLSSCGYDYVQVKQVEPNSINYSILQDGDIINGVENNYIDFVNDKYFNNLLSEAIKEKYNEYDTNSENTIVTVGNDIYKMQKKQIIFNIKRNGKELPVNGYVNVIYDAVENKYSGWTLLSSYDDNIEGEFNIQTYKYSFTESLKNCVPFTCKWAWKCLVIFGRLITGKIGLTSLGGPVTTVKTIATYSQSSMSNLLVLLPLIAVNLAVFNLLPIPALDGFQMIFVLIEWIRRKPVNPKVVNAINNIGLFALLALVIVVDILQLL